MVWAAYNRALTARPVLVKALTSLTGFTAGDILAQKVRHSMVIGQGVCADSEAIDKMKQSVYKGYPLKNC